MRGLFLAALASGLALAWPAAGQDDHMWIAQNPEYRAPSGIHCCSDRHCHRAAPGEIVRIPGGWKHAASGTTLMDGQQGVYPHEHDADLWDCFRADKLQCVFPGAGT